MTPFDRSGKTIGEKGQKGFDALSQEIYDPFVRFQPVSRVQIPSGLQFASVYEDYSIARLLLFDALDGLIYLRHWH